MLNFISTVYYLASYYFKYFSLYYSCQSYYCEQHSLAWNCQCIYPNYTYFPAESHRIARSLHSCLAARSWSGQSPGYRLLFRGLTSPFRRSVSYRNDQGFWCSGEIFNFKLLGWMWGREDCYKYLRMKKLVGYLYRCIDQNPRIIE